MGLIFRRSKSFGPFRFNWSKGGLGLSFGNRFFRKSIAPNGQSRTTVSMPGTGLSYRTSGGGLIRGILSLFR